MKAEEDGHEAKMRGESGVMQAQDGVSITTKLSVIPLESQSYEALEHVCFVHQCTPVPRGLAHSKWSKTFPEYE